MAKKPVPDFIIGKPFAQSDLRSSAAISTLFHIILLNADGSDGGQQEERGGRFAEHQGGVICIIVEHVVAAADNKENYRNGEQRAAYAQGIYKYEPRGRVHPEHPADYFLHMQHLKAILRDAGARFKLYILPALRRVGGLDFIETVRGAASGWFHEKSPVRTFLTSFIRRAF
mgnify:CR=1 FL=1